MQFEELSNRLIGCAIEVHRALGPGLLESAYEHCLAHELALQKIPFQAQVPLPVCYKGMAIDCGYRLDLMVDRGIIVELKSVANIDPIHKAQLLTYMKLANVRVGLLLNFNVSLLKDGITRLILDTGHTRKNPEARPEQM
ncbi:MAG: GxxExxY protein [Verrucomicrobiota bacterium]